MANSLMLRARRDANDHDDRDDDANRKRAKLAPTNLFHNVPPSKLRCPWCFSLNTKSWYFNNHNLGQPRYLCGACRRYWTHGETLSNIPVGGGIRWCRVFPPFRPYRMIIQLPRPQPPTIPEAYCQLQQRVTNMAGMVAGVSGIPFVTSISMHHPPTMIPIYPDGIFSALEDMQTRSRNQRRGNHTNPPLPIGGGAPTFSGIRLSTIESLLAQIEAEAQAQGQGQPPLQIHDQQPAAPPQIDIGGEGGNRSKDKQPTYPPDETVDLPIGTDMYNPWTGAENNTNMASTSNSNVWNNANGAGTSTGFTEPSSFNPNE